MQIEEVIRSFPSSIYKKINEYFINNENNMNSLEEIRIRVNKPIILKIGIKEELIDYKVTINEVLEVLQHICDNSIYSYQGQICNGYITMKGGHRVGITGSVVICDGKVTNINYISSLNFRIAKQVIGCSNKILKFVLDLKENTIYDTLIVSPPGVGKTTILRDLIRTISNGIDELNFTGITVGVVDERGEIAATYRGISQNDVGIRTDTIDGVSKQIGMTMLVRSMAPKVIAADEIGTSEGEIEAIKYAVCSGVKGLFTAHGSSMIDIELNPTLNKLIKEHIIERIIFLQENTRNGELKKVYRLNKRENKYQEY